MRLARQKALRTIIRVSNVKDAPASCGEVNATLHKRATAETAIEATLSGPTSEASPQQRVSSGLDAQLRPRHKYFGFSIQLEKAIEPFRRFSGLWGRQCDLSASSLALSRPESSLRRFASLGVQPEGVLPVTHNEPDSDFERASSSLSASTSYSLENTGIYRQSLASVDKNDKNVPLCTAIREAPDYMDVVALLERHSGQLNIFHATAAIHKLGKLIGIKRSEPDPRSAMDRPQRYHERFEFVQSKLFKQVVDKARSERRKASRDMLCLLLWGMARLKRNEAGESTPASVKDLAAELELRLRTSPRPQGSRIQLSQAMWALSQLMRRDAPWGDLLALAAEDVCLSRMPLEPGLASTFLKAAATYNVVHGDCPVPAKTLDALAAGLLEPETHSSGPQAISQGLYALGKLQHVPSDAILHAICSLVPTKVTAATIDRQAVGNTMWAMAELGVKPSNTLYRQLMQLVMIHASKFMPNHFSQLFSALLAWEMLPNPEQMQEICGSIMRGMPIWPDAELKARWEPLVGDLEAMVALYEAHGKEVPQLLRDCAVVFRDSIANESDLS